ncbi:MAG: hypothetical protein DHS20C21_13830 [Gemmatimonadota bacterium]|nr:MAG: hypothetical protein DHS20C21_13830 [Gemmatimonadota bacterium]
MATTITVFEGGRVDVPTGPSADRARVRLLGTAVGGRQAFVTRNGNVYAADCAGAVDLGDFRVEVLPKVFGVQDKVAGRAFMYDLLECTGHDAIVGWNRGGAGDTDCNLLEAVERQAVTELLTRLESGVPRRYIPVEEVTPVIRGRINFSRYVRQLPSDSHRVPVRYSPLTRDNQLSRVLKALASHLSQRTRTYTVRRDLDRCIGLLHEVKSSELTADLARSVRLGRLERDWDRVIELAELLATSRSPDPTLLGATSQPTLLFPLNRLFESVVRRVLVEELLGPLQCEPKSRAFPFLTVPKTSSVALGVRPDFTFTSGEDFVGVGDAKWKSLTASDPRHGVAPADVYQILAYMRRLKTQRGLLFYPKVDWMASAWSASFGVHGTDETVSAISVDLAKIVSRDRTTRNVARSSFAARVQAMLAPAATVSV